MKKFTNNLSRVMYLKNITRKLLIVIIYLIFFIFYFYASSYPKRLLNAFYTDKQIIFSIFGNNSGYYSVLSYTILFIIPYIIFYKLFFENSLLSHKYRIGTRLHIFKINLKKIIISSVIFTFLHDIVGFIISVVWYSFTTLNSFNIIYALSANMMLITVHFIFIGLIYELINTLVNRVTLSIVLVQLIFSILYFFFKINSSFNYLIPFNYDVSVIGGFLEHNMDIISYIIILIKGIISSIIILYVGEIVHEKKEFINER